MGNIQHLRPHQHQRLHRYIANPTFDPPWGGVYTHAADCHSSMCDGGHDHLLLLGKGERPAYALDGLSIGRSRHSRWRSTAP